MTKINEAVRRCIDNIAVAQQSIVALHVLSHRMTRNGQENEDVRKAIGVLQGQLHYDLTAAWEQLSWFAPISKQAIDLLADRTRTWFRREDTAIMQWLGMEGSYYIEDEDAFRREVLEVFGVTEEVKP